MLWKYTSQGLWSHIFSGLIPHFWQCIDNHPFMQQSYRHFPLLAILLFGLMSYDQLLLWYLKVTSLRANHSIQRPGGTEGAATGRGNPVMWWGHAGHQNLQLLRWSKTEQLLALMWNPLQGANQLSRKPCRLKGATDKRGIGLLMGCKGKAFGDCAKVIMCVECLEEKPRGGKRRDQGGLGRNKCGKIERKVDKSSWLYVKRGVSRL